jgi:hypothetical protein
VAQAVKRLISKWEALSSKLSLIKKEKNKVKKKDRKETTAQESQGRGRGVARYRGTLP